eukprot:9393936-Prorocentrum_lima.AAC.1
MVQGGAQSPSGSEGAYKPYYSSGEWKQRSGWQDYSGSEEKSPWDGWQPQQNNEGYTVYRARSKAPSTTA